MTCGPSVPSRIGSSKLSPVRLSVTVTLFRRLPPEGFAVVCAMPQSPVFTGRPRPPPPRPPPPPPPQQRQRAGGGGGPRGGARRQGGGRPPRPPPLGPEEGRVPL